MYVRLEGYFCSQCDFKTTQKSEYDVHKATEHDLKRKQNKETENAEILIDQHHLLEKQLSEPYTDKMTDKSLSYRYFCCYCGLEQFETERLLRHISVVHLKW